MANIAMSLNLDELVDLELFPTKKLQAKLQSAMNRIGRDTKNFWKSEAGRRLKTSRKDYMAAIEWESDLTKGVVIGLTGGTPRENYLANAVESGAPKRDMKPGFLEGKVKGYARIPINDAGFIHGRATEVRTVSVKSPANSWHHPEIEARNLVDAVVDELHNTIIPNRIGDLLENL